MKLRLSVIERAVLLDALREHKKANQKMTDCSIEEVADLSKLVVHICDNLLKELKSIELS